MEKSRTKMQVFVLFLLASIQEIQTIEPITTSLFFGGAVSFGVGAVYQFQCKFSECCSSPDWIPNNVTKFEEYFDKYVFGQHIVRNVVKKALRSHFKKIVQEKSNKALVLSFHGWTGTGKNYVATFIAKSLFKEGMKSGFVQIFISTVHFTDHSKVDIYKSEVQKKIIDTVRGCNKALFIFDEIDKMPEGLMDAVKPFIDYSEQVEGLDFRQTIFIFLSNTGGEEINKIAYNSWKTGRHREDLTYNDLEKLISGNAFNEKGGLHRSAVIEEFVVDWYIPFLPLERSHVTSCIIATAHDRNATIVLKPEEIDSILDQLIYLPEVALVYSVSGCKTISPKVDALIEDIVDQEYIRD